MDGGDHRKLRDLGRDPAEIDLDRLVVAFALAGSVVAGMLDRPVGRFELVVEDEIVIAADLPRFGEQEDTGVEVEILAVGRARVPAEADEDLGETGLLLVEADIGTFSEAD